MNAHSTLCPSASSPLLVDELSASASPRRTRSPLRTVGRWLMHVPWFERTNFSSGYSPLLAAVVAHLDQPRVAP